MPHPSDRLRRNPDFLKLCAGQTASLLGSQVTLLALPLAAALTLDASATEMGVLAASGSLPAVVTAPIAGVWADRVRRRPILIGADLGRALLLGTVPLAALTIGLSVEHLWLVALLAGVLTTLFDVVHPSLLPTLVRREQLVGANSALEVGRSGALIAGPGLAGLLVQLLTAPIAILADACSFLVSALLIARIRAPEPPPPRDETGRGLWSEARQGLRTVLRDPVLSAMATSLCIFNLFYNVVAAVYILFLTRELDLSPAAVGLVYAAGAAAFPVGAAVAGRVAKRLGVGGAIVWGAGVCDAGFLLLPLAGGPPAVAVAVLVASRLVAMPAGVVTAINQLSLRQAMTPAHLLGRVNGAMLTISLGTAPLGALLGGLAGEALGLRPAILIGAIGIQLGFLRLLLSPVRSVRRLPGSAEAAAGGSTPSPDRPASDPRTGR